jgi:hypothetical protein
VGWGGVGWGGVGWGGVGWGGVGVPPRAAAPCRARQGASPGRAGVGGRHPARALIVAWREGNAAFRLRLPRAQTDGRAVSLAGRGRGAPVPACAGVWGRPPRPGRIWKRSPRRTGASHIATRPFPGPQPAPHQHPARDGVALQGGRPQGQGEGVTRRRSDDALGAGRCGRRGAPRCAGRGAGTCAPRAAPAVAGAATGPPKPPAPRTQLPRDLEPDARRAARDDGHLRGRVGGRAGREAGAWAGGVAQRQRGAAAARPAPAPRRAAPGPTRPQRRDRIAPTLPLRASALKGDPITRWVLMWRGLGAGKRACGDVGSSGSARRSLPNAAGPRGAAPNAGTSRNWGATAAPGQ